ERVVAVDPSDGEDTGDGYGVAVCSRGADGVGYVEKSYEWFGQTTELARRTINLANTVGADSVIIERNHGGRWMLAVFRQIDPYFTIRDVWASDGKRTRARPVAALFQPDPEMEATRLYRARLVGFHEDLEEEMTSTIFDGTEDSPNRVDAMVWGMTHLMLKRTLGRKVEDGNARKRDRRLRRR
ncbi:MAG: hypothetical protein M3Q75_15380, partial [Gemmatimonadota bacterium]|nr:hypothetical protein [Gemmatimonadota bacterium]